MKQIFEKKKLWEYGAMLLAALTLFLVLLFFMVFPDNLMHSDMAAEVILSKLLAKEGRLISPNWFYSTEIRIIYTQLIMTPLFMIFSDYGTVKLISVIVLDLLLAVVFLFTAKECELKGAKKWLALSLLLAPLSNEYLDMMFLGCFYTCQVICTYLVLKFFLKDRPEKKGIMWTRSAVLTLAALILGTSGLRYLASLYLPLIGAVALSYGLDKKEEQHKELSDKLILSLLMCLGAGIGFLINKFYLAGHYAFDNTSAVAFVSPSEVSARFLAFPRMILEFFGYRVVAAVTPMGMVNVIKFAFVLFLIYVIIYLTKHRYEVLNKTQRLLLYYFYGCFFLNWYMLMFTSVLLQYRYWIPVYVTGVFLAGIYLQNAREKTRFFVPAMAALSVLVVLSSLYGELWQDTKYNDCEKRYGYMAFLEESDYTFGYATFWNSSVTEYLSDGQIQVAHMDIDTQPTMPYEWLCPKYYYEEGYYEGKTFMLLARSEELAMFNGEISIMQDGVKVYEDEYYVIYEGEGMYLFSSGGEE
ncbi:MAG: hypothetical protein J1E61_00765 [Lachnospiraceae bacterium]|nr:hypothetical protein [Lachnospiraceae bacterium]